MVFDAMIDEEANEWQITGPELQCLYENLMSNNFRKTAFVEKKMWIVKEAIQSKGLY